MSEIQEDWIPVIGYEEFYEITKTGRIRSKQRTVISTRGRVMNVGKELKTRVENTGYIVVNLCRGDRHPKLMSMHRLMAINFIPNPEGKSQVNHKNSDRTDFRIENLEWVTPLENSHHALKVGRLNMGMPCAVPVINKKTGVVFKTMKSAAKSIGMQEDRFRKMMIGLTKNITEFITLAAHEAETRAQK